MVLVAPGRWDFGACTGLIHQALICSQEQRETRELDCGGVGVDASLRLTAGLMSLATDSIPKRVQHCTERTEIWLLIPPKSGDRRLNMVSRAPALGGITLGWEQGELGARIGGCLVI